MPTFSKRSRENLDTCHRDIQRLFIEVVKIFDCSIDCGHRPESEQDYVFKQGRSTKRWPDSTHNEIPSKGVDAIPFPIIWPDKRNRPNDYVKDLGRFYMFDGYVLGIASQMGIEIISGSDWDRDFNLLDQRFDDLPHFQLIL